MTQKFVTLFTLLLSVSLKSTSSSGLVDVVVVPSEKELPVGDSVTLTCSLDDAYQEVLGSSISWEYPHDVNMDTVTIESTFFTITSMAESNIGTYTCKYIGIKDNVFHKGTGSSVITIKPEKPGQPQKLAIAGFTEDSITMEWEAGFWGYADTLYYKLEIMEEDSTWTPWEEDIAADVLEYTAEGLRSEQSYKFRISQVSKGGQSIASDPSSSIYLAKAGAVTVYPTIERLEQYNATAIRVIWKMPEFSDIVSEWYVEYRIKNEGDTYKALQVERQDLSTTISTLGGLEEASTYQIRMYCRNEHGRGPPSHVMEETTDEAAPSAPAQDVRAVFVDIEKREMDIRWSQPRQRDINGVLTGYQIKLYYTNPADDNTTVESTFKDVGREPRQLTLYPTSLPCWVAVAAKTGEGIGPFSDFQKVALPIEEEAVKDGAMDEVIAMFKQPWVIALVGALLLILIVMISIIACRQQKIKRRKLEQQQHTPFLNSYHRMRDDGPQYEKIPDSRNTTPHDSGIAIPPPIPARNTLRRQSSETIDSTVTCPDYSEIQSDHEYANNNERLVSSSTLPRREKMLHDKVVRDNMIHEKVNSYIDNRMPPQNYCPSNISMDSRQYSMSQNSSIDDLASTIPSVTYSIPHNRDGYKVVNPTHNDGPGREIPVAKVPPKAKEHDPNAIKPKVYGNITVKEWRDQQLRKKTRGGGESDTSLLSSFGKDSGRGSTDNVSVSGSESEEGSDVEKYLEEDFSPRNSGYFEDDLMDVARMGMSRSPPDSSAFLNPNNRAKPPQPPIAAENNHRPDDNTSIESDMYMRCEAAPNTAQPANIYNLNGGVSDADV
ncbi:roundabout homolog 2-like isoform X3 [Bolinopsis microptera]|uniref:roundabout homolog 2-like isoform X3 n=1 Tax=Bolinopsis microptera TaxID=2820187 RepID=UPI00307A5F7D